MPSKRKMSCLWKKLRRGRRLETIIRSGLKWKRSLRDINLEKSGLKKGTKTQGFFIEWPILIGGGILLGASVLMAKGLSRRLRLKKFW